MFLAVKEILHEKLRYSLIISMFVLIGYLIFILTGLAQGLAGQNTEVLDTWGARSILLNKDSNTNISQSMITNDQYKNINMNSKDASVAQMGVVVKSKDRSQVSGSFMGIKTDEFIYKDLKITEGKKSIKNKDVVVDSSYKNNGYKIGDKIKFNSSKTEFKIVGFTENAKLNIAPIIYGSTDNWSTLRGMGNTVVASAVISKNDKVKFSSDQLKSYPIGQFINKLPGYSAQVATFTFMIAFLMVISLIVITVFLYILTIQKLPNYAVLRAQGVPASILVKTTIYQSLILVIVGLLVAVILTAITGLLIPASVPIFFDVKMLSLVSLGIVLTSLLGSLIPVRTILKIDPVSIL
ncbi:ABC transporter permease [Companilactobacillus metriopterae]|uniref:ABC transporter permease n=1 Tax=Companilactobacillus metriopterae TaxID=1909267 RepID=UPI00100B1D22|nr:FtsX-like permease family protein [Companilactobacillus metriopterae]